MKIRNRVTQTLNKLKPLAVALSLGIGLGAGSAHAATLTWALTGGGAWDTATANWTGDATTFVSDGTQDVIFDKAGGTITVDADMDPLSTTVNSAGNYNFSGGAITGAGSLTKAGNGTLTIYNVNSYTGKTTVQAGTLLLSPSVYLSKAGFDGPLGAPVGANSTIDLHNGVVFQMGSTSPRKNQITDRNLNLAGTGAGTVNVRVNDNDTLFQFGGVTATGTGPKSLNLFTGYKGNGDREALVFTGPIEDSSDASPTSVSVLFRTQDSNWLCLSAVNTFTGPLTLQTNGPHPGYLVVGGVKAQASGAVTVGTGSLANGNYLANIAIGAQTIFEYASTAPQILAGTISGNGALQVSGSGVLTLSGTNTYSGNTTVNSGCTLELDAAGGLSFAVTDEATNNKITGAGTANLDGTFTIDTSAVTSPLASWTLVDTSAKVFGSTFNVAGFDDSDLDDVWTKVEGLTTWTFSEATGVLSVNTLAAMTAFNVPGYHGVIDNVALTIALYMPYATDLTTLAPTFTVTSGTVTANGNAVSSGSAPTPAFSVTNPATYTVTDGIAVSTYTVTVIVPPAPPAGLGVDDGLVAWFDAAAGTTTDGAGLLRWIDQSGNSHHATRTLGTLSIIPAAVNGLPAVRFGGNSYASMAGTMYSKTQFIVTKMDGGDWGSWMGSQVRSGYMWNQDGTAWGSNIPAAASKNGVALAGPAFSLAPNHNSEFMIVKIVGNDNNITPRLYELGRQETWYNLKNYMAEIITYDRVLTSEEENKVGSYLANKYGLASEYLVADFKTFGVTGSEGVIDHQAKTISLTVPFGTNLATLAPTFTLSSDTATANQTSGSPPSPTFAVQNPATYTVTDGATVNDYTVTITVLPDTTTYVINLGTSPAGTTIVSGEFGKYGIVNLPSLPPGSILRSIKAESVNLEATDAENLTSDLAFLVDPTPGTPGGDFSLEVTNGTFFGATKALGWANGDNGVGTPLDDTKTDGDWASLGAIDLSTSGIFLGNAYGTAPAGGTWSGTITLTYDIVAAGTPYSIWAGGAAFDADTNGDGVSNGLAWMLGAADPNVNSNSLLPTVGQSAGGLTLTFKRVNPMGSATLSVEYSSDLGLTDAWHSAVVPATSQTFGGDLNAVITPGSPTDQVTLTIPAAHNAGGHLFGRLKVTQ